MALDSQIASAARRESKPVSMKVFKNLLDTIQDATAGQWATFTVDVITTARSQRMPRLELLETLAMLGIAGDDLKPHAVTGKTLPARGRCQTCRNMQDLQNDGTVRSHKRGGLHCPGRYEPPTAEPAQVAS